MIETICKVHKKYYGDSDECVTELVKDIINNYFVTEFDERYNALFEAVLNKDLFHCEMHNTDIGAVADELAEILTWKHEDNGDNFIIIFDDFRLIIDYESNACKVTK